MLGREHIQGPLAGSTLILVAGFLLLLGASSAAAFDAEDTLQPMTKVISAEGGLENFTSGRLAGGFINAWSVGARVSLLPFGVIHRPLVLHGTLDGALEVGVAPTFERFNTVHQNFAGLLFEGRYYLVHLRYGRLVPWIGGAIGPGYSDLDIGRGRDGNHLSGPFMASINGEAGVICFIDERRAIYAGLKAQHFSNGSLNGAGINASLNTPWGMVVGFSWFFR